MNAGEMIEAVVRARGSLLRIEDELICEEPDWMKIAREIGLLTTNFPNITAEVVIRALRAGASQRAVEDAIGLSRGYLRGWKKELARDA